MNKKQALEWYQTVVKDGSFPERTKFFESIEPMEFGILGDIAKRMSEQRDDRFLLGLDFGIMIALDKVFGFRKK